MNVQNHKWVGVGLVVLATLSACSPQQPDLGTETLAETKSPVQLLRNTTAGRVDDAAIAETRQGADGSVACSDQFENPDGLLRQWISSVDLALTSEADLTAVSSALIESLVADGWQRRDVSAGESFSLTVLTTEKSVAQVQIEASAESEGGLLRITSTGPCVVTDGPDSEEVLALEG
jgi:hypothetical protein